MGKGWKNPIKEAAAQQKGKLFTKLAKEIAVAAKLGGPDVEGNSRLKLAISVAREALCPKDTIERAIKRGSGQLDAQAIEELTYEGYGPHGVGVIVECQTDNKNRTASEIRNVFKTHDGNMGESGSVSWMFERQSLFTGTHPKVEDPEVEAIEVGANHVEEGEEAGTWKFYGNPQDLDSIRTALTSRGWSLSAAELGFRAKNITTLTEEQTKEVHEFLQDLDDNDDSHRIYATL